ncbi:hypothetical protein, partial [Klebsiella pneumoniae]|uniref:hypothetical protein n=1 Tax=Klebsiella pneumoniae TaxID=573 RepID=UPI003745D3EB
SPDEVDPRQRDEQHQRGQDKQHPGDDASPGLCASIRFIFGHCLFYGKINRRVWGRSYYNHYRIFYNNPIFSFCI